jgi:GNAT superfamily N-acetyltransferase
MRRPQGGTCGDADWGPVARNRGPRPPLPAGWPSNRPQASIPHGHLITQDMPLEISTDPSRLDRELIYNYLHEDAYWSKGISREAVEIALERSTCFGAFENAAQVGFARAVSDHATFAYLCDVFVVPPWRGRGVGKALMRAVLDHPSVKGIRRVVLVTQDAHSLYEPLGFRPIADVERWMAIELTPYEAYEQTPAPPWPPR